MRKWSTRIAQEGEWYRTCDECSYNQVAIRPDPNKELPDSYRNRKCKNCHSMALDYGKEMYSDENS